MFYKKSHLIFSFLLIFFISCKIETIENNDFTNYLISSEIFDKYKGEYSDSSVNEIESIKIIYNLDIDSIYYLNSKEFNHFQFAKKYFGFNEGWDKFISTQYTKNGSRILLLASINYYKSNELYTLETIAFDNMDCKQVELLYNKVIDNSFLSEKNFYYHSISNTNENCINIPFITTDSLYKNQNFQSLNAEENYGYLRKINIVDLKNSCIKETDIVLTNNIPIDLPIISGLITTKFQTPLNHVNVLNHNRNIPSMALKNGWENRMFDTLIDKLIYFKVDINSFEIRPATLIEAEPFWNNRKNSKTIELKKDINFSKLVDISKCNINYAIKIGSKASNLAEVYRANVNIPECSFAIPFYFYEQHFKASNNIEELKNLMKDSIFLNNENFRKEKLEQIRNNIINFPISSKLLNLVNNKLKNYNDFENFRFRSSSNAEDLDFFSGAGLYNSYSAKKNELAKIELVIKKVWASLWNYSAFEERKHYNIAQLSSTMGILVHRSFPNENANGVVVTKNLYNGNHGYIVNVQIGNNDVVNLNEKRTDDQIILYTFSLTNNTKYTISYIANSNILSKQYKTVLSNDELYSLGDACTLLEEYFYKNIYHSNKSIKDFALDIEFKFDSEVSNRKLYIKQVRLYK